MAAVDKGAVDICLDNEENKVLKAVLVTPLIDGFLVPLTLVRRNTKKSASSAAARRMKPVELFALFDLFVWEDAMICGWTCCRCRDKFYCRHRIVGTAARDALSSIGGGEG